MNSGMEDAIPKNQDRPEAVTWNVFQMKEGWWSVAFLKYRWMLFSELPFYSEERAEEEQEAHFPEA